MTESNSTKQTLETLTNCNSASPRLTRISSKFLSNSVLDHFSCYSLYDEKKKSAFQLTQQNRLRFKQNSIKYPRSPQSFQLTTVIVPYSIPGPSPSKTFYMMLKLKFNNCVLPTPTFCQSKKVPLAKNNWSQVFRRGKLFLNSMPHPKMERCFVSKVKRFQIGILINLCQMPLAILIKTGFSSKTDF